MSCTSLARESGDNPCARGYFGCTAGICEPRRNDRRGGGGPWSGLVPHRYFGTGPNDRGHHCRRTPCRSSHLDCELPQAERSFGEDLRDQSRIIASRSPAEAKGLDESSQSEHHTNVRVIL